MSEGMRPKSHSLMRWIIILGVMLLIVLIIGSVPVIISNRKAMDA